MIGNEILSGLVRHNTFLFFNTYIHLFAGIFIATALYPFLSKTIKKRWNYVCVIFFPAVFGSVFPDLMFIVSSIVERRTVENLFWILSTGGTVHSAFHFHFSIILVAPATLFCIMLLNRVMKKSYFDHLPKWSFLWITMISLFAAFFHVYMDLVGF